MKKKKNSFNIKNFIIKNKISECFLLIGIVIGLLIMSLFIPERIAKLENGTMPIVTLKSFQVTADDYYLTLKDTISIELLVQEIDTKILNSKYETTKEMKKEVEEKMTSTIKEYTDYYQYSEKDFLTNNGFKDKNEFYQLLELEHKRKMYLEEYVSENIKSEEISNYYIKNVNPDMEIKYIQGNEETLNSILKLLNEGKTYDEVIKSYKGKVNYKDYSYVSFDNEEVSSDIYTNALGLKENSYTTTLVNVGNNYYIVFKGDVKEKDKVDDIKPRIITKLKDQKIANDTDNKLYYKALIYLREKENITFNDTSFKELYDNYIKSYK